MSVVRKRKVSDREEVVEEGDLRGVVLEVEPSTNIVISLSSRATSDANRWETMPSLEPYPSLQKLDLYKNRYITVLDDSVTQLQNLRSISLVGCKRLKALPSSIGQLQSLEEVRTMRWNNRIDSQYAAAKAAMFLVIH